MLNDLYFKTTCNIRPHFLGPKGGLKTEGSLYMNYDNTNFDSYDMHLSENTSIESVARYVFRYTVLSFVQSFTKALPVSQVHYKVNVIISKQLFHRVNSFNIYCVRSIIGSQIANREISSLVIDAL